MVKYNDNACQLLFSFKGNLVRFAHNWNVGLPWRDSFGEFSDSQKPGLGQGLLE